MYNRQEIGKIGEDKACELLLKEGYKIIERNFRCKLGEVDIIAQDKNNDLVFIEVKTRRSFRYGIPCEAINKTKKIHIYKVAKFYILKNKISNKNIRFDAIEIKLGKDGFIHHIKQAF